MFVALLLSVALARPTVMSWDDWKATYEKSYVSNSEHDYRQKVYKKNVALITKNNAANGNFKMGVNQFADLTAKEFARQYLSPMNVTRKLDIEVLTHEAADEVDWRTKGAVTPVKNQEQCGSCWAFSTTGSVEGAVQISSGKLPVLSEQQLVDCSTKEGDHGCGGGLMDFGFQYIIDNGGIDSETDYPYKAKDGRCDKTKEANHVATITGFKDVTPRSSDQLAAAITLGPVSVAIEADQSSFQLYHSGILDKPCGSKLDHGVLAVGYAADYWIVKNSWGASWGEEGYVRLSRSVGGTAGQCGIQMQPSYPIAGDAPGPTPGPGPTPKPGPSPGPPYENPGKSGQCESDEIAVQVQGVEGSYCTPKCTLFKRCPDAPDGITGAQAQCALSDESTGQKYCALICSPRDDTSCDPSAGMTCKSISGTGICTYNQDAGDKPFTALLTL